MSDLITDAMVEAARQADYLHDPQRMECLNHDGSCCPAFDHNVGDERTHRVRAAIEAAAPAIAAKALQDAADELRRLDDGRTGGYYEAGRDIIQRLAARADRIERGEA